MRTCLMFVFSCICLLFVLEANSQGQQQVESRVASQLPDRREAGTEFHRSIENLLPEIAAAVTKRREMLGISNKMTDEELGYFRDQGTHWHILYDFVAEFGISPEENTALASSGLTFALDEATQFNAWHWAALSDVIVEGTVKDIKGFDNGPYHTRIQLDISTTYKNCEPRNVGGLRTFWLLNTGPHRHGDHIDNRIDPTEPEFRIGERVVLMAGREPHSLRTLVGNSLMADQIDKVAETYGNKEEIFEQASKGTPGVLEIYSAYKVVRHNLVTKAGGFRVKQTTDVIDKENFAERVSSIYRNQEGFCRERVAAKENRL